MIRRGGAGTSHAGASRALPHRGSTVATQPYSASNALAALGEALADIKREDGLTFADLGAVLGKSDDQAAKYTDGSATMDVVTFGRGRREWGARFTGRFDLLCEAARRGAGGDRGALTVILVLVTELNRALEDEEVCEDDAEEMRVNLLEARAAIDGLLAKIPPSHR
jgi:hypothetical protein